MRCAPTLVARACGARSDRSAAALLALSVLGLSGCLRFGYDERPVPAADGGKTSPTDAAPPDAPGRDADADPDASTARDAAAAIDAAADVDAAAPTPDASETGDAATSSRDAGPTEDASGATDSGVDCTPSVIRDYCTRLPALPQPPELDGVLDCGPMLVELPPSGWNSSQPLPSDNHARYAAAWRPEGLYLYVEVDDPLRLPALASDVNPWCGDGIELYADADGDYEEAPDYDDPGAIQLLAAAPARDSSTARAIDARYHTRSQLRAGDWAATRHVMVPRTAGYALEAFVTATELELNSWQLERGAKVGFDIAINVSVANEAQKFGCGYVLGQYYLRVSSLPCNTDDCRPYSNAAAFCTALLE